MPKLFDTLQKELISAQKAKDVTRVSTLRMVISEMKNRQINTQKDLTEADEMAVMKSEVKKRKDAIEQFEKGGRSDLVAKEKSELEILGSFLPAEMSEQDIQALVDAAVLPGMTMKDMGSVMGKIMADTKGAADGKMVSDLVKKKLASHG